LFEKHKEFIRKTSKTPNRPTLKPVCKGISAFQTALQNPLKSQMARLKWVQSRELSPNTPTLKVL